MMRLEEVRRIDWRFLLPDARLGEVACLGPQGTSLTRALQQSARQLETFPAGDASWLSRSGCFDLVVCTNGVEDLSKAHILLRQGGFLYWEIRRFSSLDLGSTGDFARSARREGFEDVEVYWHRRGFENCLEIIRLREEALRFVFFRNTDRPLKRIKLRMGWLLAKTGLLER